MNKAKIEKALSAFFAKAGKKGGKARAKNMSAEKRKAIAKKAARARWAKEYR
jgi:hypothetical protein